MELEVRGDMLKIHSISIKISKINKKAKFKIKSSNEIERYYSSFYFFLVGIS